MTEAEKAGKAAGERGMRGNESCPYREWTEDWFDWWKEFYRAGGKP